MTFYVGIPPDSYRDRTWDPSAALAFDKSCVAECATGAAMQSKQELGFYSFCFSEIVLVGQPRILLKSLCYRGAAIVLSPWYMYWDHYYVLTIDHQDCLWTLFTKSLKIQIVRCRCRIPYLINKKRPSLRMTFYVGIPGFEPGTLPPHLLFLKAAWRNALPGLRCYPSKNSTFTFFAF